MVSFKCQPGKCLREALSTSGIGRGCLDYANLRWEDQTTMGGIIP